MLYYEDTKLKRRKKGVVRTKVNKYIRVFAKALIIGELIVSRQNLVEFGK